MSNPTYPNNPLNAPVWKPTKNGSYKEGDIIFTSGEYSRRSAPGRVDWWDTISLEEAALGLGRDLRQDTESEVWDD